MATPVSVTCTADTWVKVATGVTSTIIHRISTAPNVYKMTYVPNAAAAPADDSLAALMFSDSPNEEKFTNSSSSDVYVKAVKVDGEVRVDL
jgi:hypothetical protein